MKCKYIFWRKGVGRQLYQDVREEVDTGKPPYIQEVYDILPIPFGHAQCTSEDPINARFGLL